MLAFKKIFKQNKIIKTENYFFEMVAIPSELTYSYL